MNTKFLLSWLLLTITASVSGIGNTTRGNELSQVPPSIPLLNAHVSILTPVAYWKMEEGTGTTVSDSSGHGHASLFPGGTSNPTWSSDVPSTISGTSFSLDFDGSDDYISAEDVIEMTGSSQLTVEAWVKLDQAQPYRVLVSAFEHAFATQWMLMMDGTGRELQVLIADGSSINLCCDPSHLRPGAITVGANLQNNQWYHVAFVFNGNGTTNQDRLRIFVNGQRKQVAIDGTVPNVLQNVSPEVKIGGEPSIAGLFSSYFQGNIDEVLIYNSARSDAEIAADASGGTIPTPTPGATFTPTPTLSLTPGDPVAYWRMEEGSGFTSVDASGREHTLHLTNNSALPAWSIDAPPLVGGNQFSLHFDGSNDYAHATNLPEVDGGAQLTIEAWIKLDQAQPYRVSCFSLSTILCNTVDAHD